MEEANGDNVAERPSPQPFNPHSEDESDDENNIPRIRRHLNERPPLFVAVQQGNVEMVKTLLDDGFDVNNKYGYEEETALHQASMYDRVDVARMLFNYGANANAKSYYGKTPMHYVHSVAMTRLLLHNGASINARNNSGHTPLF